MLKAQVAMGGSCRVFSGEGSILQGGFAPNRLRIKFEFQKEGR